MASDPLQIDPKYLNESERNEYLEIFAILNNLRYNLSAANYSSVGFEYHDLVKRALLLNNKNHMIMNDIEAKLIAEKSKQEMDELLKKSRIARQLKIESEHEEYWGG